MALFRSRMLLLLMFAGVLLVACSDEESRPAATSTGTSTATAEGTAGASATASGSNPTAMATVTGTGVATAAETNSVDGVRAFARTIDEALGRGEVAAVTSRLRGTPEVAFSQWRQPASTLPLERARTELTQLLSRTRGSDRDAYGMAAPKVWWVGYEMSRPNLVVTAISLDEATGYRRLGVLLQLRYCESGCAAEDRGRWVISGVVLDRGDALLAAGDEFAAAFGRPGERYRRPLVLTPEIRTAAEDVAEAFGETVRAIPDCVPAAPCITTGDAGTSVDLGVMRLGFQEATPPGGGALVFAGRTPDGAWRFWFGTQNVFYQLVDLPGDVLVCADGDGLNVRERADASSASAGFVPDGARLRAVEFVLTAPGIAPTGRGSGWYRVEAGDLHRAGWVSSRFVTDARLQDCQIRDGFERQ